MSPARSALTPLIVAGLLAGGAGRARAVGLDGADVAAVRRLVAAGAGVDQVGGYGRDRYGYLDVAAAGEARVWKRLVVGGALSYRQDVSNYNFALDGSRPRHDPTLAAQLFAGYDGPSFHISAGPWLYGSRRDRRSFRATVLPYGVLRLRFGNLDRWHFNARVADGAPFTSEGGSLGMRLYLGAPPFGNHRAQAGLYTSIGEKVVGAGAIDEIAGAGPMGGALRVGLLLGTDMDHPGRPELTASAGVTW